MAAKRPRNHTIASPGAASGEWTGDRLDLGLSGREDQGERNLLAGLESRVNSHPRQLAQLRVERRRGVQDQDQELPPRRATKDPQPGVRSGSRLSAVHREGAGDRFGEVERPQAEGQRRLEPGPPRLGAPRRRLLRLSAGRQHGHAA